MLETWRIQYLWKGKTHRRPPKSLRIPKIITVNLAKNLENSHTIRGQTARIIHQNEEKGSTANPKVPGKEGFDEQQRIKMGPYNKVLIAKGNLGGNNNI
jgi:hypothetical protein